MLPLQGVCAASVWFLYNENNKYHREFVAEGEKQLLKALPNVKIKIIGTGTAANEILTDKNSLVITLGNDAAQQAAALKHPTTNLLISRLNFELIKDTYTSPVSAVYIEQSAQHYLQLLKIAMPSKKSFSMLQGQQPQSIIDDLSKQARRAKVQMNQVEVEPNLDMSKLFGNKLPDSMPLLLLPDPSIVNRRLIKPLVLESYSRSIPLIGYSRAMVKAGALMAVYSSQDDIRSEMLERVTRYFEKGKWTNAGYAKGFDVSVNYQLARYLEISIPSELVLSKQLEEQLR